MAGELQFHHTGAALEKERVVIVCPVQNRRKPNEEIRSLEATEQEAVSLAEAIELRVEHVMTVRVPSFYPATLLGTGKVEELKELMEAEDIPLLIIDRQLSPVQQRNLEKQLNRKVIDRTQLILEIFGTRARTREGKLQVELAMMHYQKSRLVRSWSHLERQRGGGGFTGGPGERQIELDRRILQDKILKLQRELEQVRRTRELHRKTRRDTPYPIVALVGYTNAGKSTLFNRLTGADVLAKDMLFATLDPTLRSLKLPDGAEIMLSDTVGFVSNLPTQLVAAFRSTLEEVVEADMILHVRDIAHPDHELQRQDVLKVLEGLGITEAEQQKIIEVYNKIDLLDADTQAYVQERAAAEDRCFALSAATGQGLEPLKNFLSRELMQEAVELSVFLAPNESKWRAWLHGKADVLAEEFTEDGTRLTLRMTPKFAGQYLRELARA